ncbi:hypothetical protein GCM10011386_38280 [Parapedobacter defluvii]|uniref:Uncharacterized protein n=1 Tax=Parapedobacter defluvii TaxID=2045106 RepID=A0ABQ1ML63_9SPHI|nr:hypothetical protein [Parapedobacter defluvii]GGC42410.1 hypothetical protein GCM10011386_38280 [Parapedobacter defluvii]
MNNHARKRNRGNRHPANSFALKFRRKKDTPRQRIRQVLRASIPLPDVEKIDLTDTPELP